MRSKKKFQIGLVFSIIGLGLFFYHMVQYIDLIERINVLSILLGGAGIDPSSIILEVFLGFGAIIIGIIYLSSMYSDIKKRESKEPKVFYPQQSDISFQYCQNCGQKNSITNSKFCVKCGDTLFNSI